MTRAGTVTEVDALIQPPDVLAKTAARVGARRRGEGPVALLAEISDAGRQVAPWDSATLIDIAVIAL